MIRLQDNVHAMHNCSLTMLDPERVKPSPWTVDDWPLPQLEFDRLKLAIESFGGNVQPIRVRSNASALLPFETDAEPDDGRFEIVFGYARVRACAELGLPVFAMVECLSERDAVLQFAAEFRSHSNWRPWRLGLLLDRTIERGLVPTMRKAAEAFSMDLSEFSLLRELARLPSSVRRAHDSVTLQPAQARKLIKAFQHNEQAMTRKAAEGNFEFCRTAPAVLATLTEQRA